jgi:hypothetical protein
MFRQYLTILFILLFQTVAVFGQKTLSRIDYEKAIDNLNCSLAKFYIEENQGVYELQAYNDSVAQFGCSYEHLMVFIKQKQPQMETNGYLAAYINSLKGEYELQATNSALFNRTVEIFKEEVLINYDSRADYQELKENLIQELKEALRIDEIADDEGQLQESETNSWTSFQDLTALKIILIIFGILLLLLLLGIGRWALKYVQTGKEDKSSYLPIRNQNLPPSNTTVTTTTTTNTTTETPKDLNTKYAEPKQPTTPKPKTVVEKIQEAPTPPEPEINAAAEIEEADQLESFYMPYPKIDGSFYESARHEVFEYGKSTFRFEIKVVEYNLATFEIISNEDVITDIFVNPEIINPVCEIQGKNKNINSTLKSGVSKIVTVRPGTVQLRNSHWRLKQKATIRFEYEGE